MSLSWEKEYKEKLKTPQEAAKAVKSGDIVYIGCSSSIAYTLSEALSARENEVENVTIACFMVTHPNSLFSGKNPRAFKCLTFFMGPSERQMQKRGLADYTSLSYSEVDIFCKRTAPADVAFLHVSSPDESGYMSFGSAGVSMHTFVREAAKSIVLQVNRQMPYVYGEQNLIHVSEADAIVEVDEDMPGLETSIPIDEVMQSISNYLLEQISDGACIQLGTGGVATAVGYGLKKKNDLGIHSEMISDSLMELMQMGIVNNSRKQYLPHKTVTSFALGSKDLYRFLDHNPDVYFMPSLLVNDPAVIARNDNMISINTAMAIDILGQVCADNIAGRQHSAIGGQVDFVRGAQLSKGGKSFIAIASTYETKNGRSSRIVTHLPPGSAVTTSRSDVQYVATEFGCVNLKPLSMQGRIRAMISLAHPDFRDMLTDEAKAAGVY
ncbi:MAG: acetyl-CoA hydrolase [Gracilibacteraceae bacterium]|jgi:4-hydroxybutyrate CoA-transferase|nr:acetyl-CoA hydrolase [Gracilibacteraceae bacterium]